MRLLILTLFYITMLSPSYGQGKSYYLTGKSDSLFVEMVFFKKNDSIMFYVFDKEMKQIGLSKLKGQVNFVFGKNAFIVIKLDSSKYNPYYGRIQFALPKTYWENFVTCELHIPVRGQMNRFVIDNIYKEQEKKEKHHDMPAPGGHGH